MRQYFGYWTSIALQWCKKTRFSQFTLSLKVIMVIFTKHLKLWNKNIIVEASMLVDLLSYIVSSKKVQAFLLFHVHKIGNGEFLFHWVK